MNPIRKKPILTLLLAGLWLLGQGCAEALEKDLSGKQVVITAPSNGVTLPDSVALTFAWDSLDGATKYKLQLVSTTFDSIAEVLADTTVRSTGFQLAPPLPAGRYQWRVRASNNTSTSDYSNPRNLFIH